MKLNNRGFVASGVIYSLLILFLTLLLGLMAMFSSRKMILDKLKSDVLGDVTPVTYNYYEDGTPIYFNPVTGKLCIDYSQTNSKTGVKLGCLKWYAFGDGGINDSTVNLLLDHNLSIDVWNSDGDNTKGMIEVADSLKSETNSWTGIPNLKMSFDNFDYNDYKARLITADEIAKVVKVQNWDSASKNTSWFYLDSTSTGTPQIQINTCKVGNITGCQYGWIYDRTSSSCQSNGCLNNSTSDQENGYWTSTSTYGDQSSAWVVKSDGTLNKEKVNSFKYGVRPVITIDKTKISSYVLPSLVNISKNKTTAEGTELDPYYVDSIEDLVVLSNNVNKGTTYADKYIYLTKNLDFKNKENYINSGSTEYGDINGDGVVKTIYEELTSSSGFMPIGNETNSFIGTFSGNNKTISNLLINRNQTYQGLFGNNSGTINSISINGNVTGIYRVAGIAGYNKGTINDAHSNTTVKLTLVANYSAGNTTYFGGTVGGIVGNNIGTIMNSSNTGNISMTYNSGTNDNGYIGGISGYNNSGGSISNCFNSGTIIGASSRDTVTGGIAGANYNTSIVTNSYNKGSLTSSATSASYSGGVVGLNRANISNSYNIGTMGSTASGNKCMTYNDTGVTTSIITNSYYLSTCTLGGGGTSKTSNELKALTSTLGSAFKTDSNNINNGYPILSWQ